MESAFSHTSEGTAPLKAVFRPSFKVHVHACAYACVHVQEGGHYGI